jgi:hypothetical protein
VEALRALPKPSSYPDNNRIGTVERTTYTLTANLLKMKREDDRDVHLVIADAATSNTMIVELVDVACSGAISSPYKSQMQSARQAFEAACGTPTTSFKDLTGTATMTGVGFFDVIHGQTGVAPNGIELHPLISFSSVNCSVVGATPTNTASPTTIATPTSTPVGVCGGATATITGLDKSSQPEVVTINGSGNLTGWYLISLTGNQRFDFPSGFVAAGTVQIESYTPEFTNTSTMLWWTAAAVWNNSSNDDAALYNCVGTQVSFFDDGV